MRTFIAPIAGITAVIAVVFGLIYFLFGPVQAMMLMFVALSLFMMLVILIQRPKGGGLSGAFGGAGGDQGAVFGSKAGDVLTYITIVCFLLFLGLGIGLTYAVRAEVEGASAEEDTEEVEAQGEGAGSGPVIDLTELEDAPPTPDAPEVPEVEPDANDPEVDPEALTQDPAQGENPAE